MSNTSVGNIAYRFVTAVDVAAAVVAVPVAVAVLASATAVRPAATDGRAVLTSSQCVSWHPRVAQLVQDLAESSSVDRRKTFVSPHQRGLSVSCKQHCDDDFILSGAAVQKKIRHQKEESHRVKS